MSFFVGGIYQCNTLTQMQFKQIHGAKFGAFKICLKAIGMHNQNFKKSDVEGQ